MFIEPKIDLKVLSQHVLRLSDFFIDQPDSQTPWQENYCQLAYRHYYLPLNYLRNDLVMRRGEQVGFFVGLNQTVDWGSGPGTASLALAKLPGLKKQILIEKSQTAIKTFVDLQTHLVRPTATTELKLKDLDLNYAQALLTFSYSLTEMQTLPVGWDQFEALMILEPSTRQDGRKLLELRQKLIDEGYSIWAPCLHQKACPLLVESKTDWCHDRVHVDAPEWFKKLEQSLPFKNNTVTTSYILARRKKAPVPVENRMRLTGDSLNEKGKTRQLACRNSKREFLTWMHKEIEPQTLPRGEIVELPVEYSLKSNEVRLAQPCRLVNE